MENYTPKFVYPLVKTDEWKKLTGELPVKMTNDYIFRALLQSDNEVLKHLLASLLRVDVSTINSAEVTNPILLGESIDEKTYILDIKVMMNNNSVINLEMQVIRQPGWNERSLIYACRTYDDLQRGAAYTEVKPVRQIAFCDFTLFEEYPEFYSTYKLINEKNHKVVYTDTFAISNVDLTRVDLATRKDKKYGLDRWCRLFKARRWEDMHILANESDVMSRAISGVWQLTEEERIREQALAREEWIVNDKWKNDTITNQSVMIKQLTETNEQQAQQIEQQAQQIEQQAGQIEQLKNANSQQADQIKQLNIANSQQAEQFQKILVNFNRLAEEFDQFKKEKKGDSV